MMSPLRCTVQYSTAVEIVNIDLPIICLDSILKGEISILLRFQALYLFGCAGGVGIRISWACGASDRDRSIGRGLGVVDWSLGTA